MSQFQYVGKTMNGRVKKGNLTGATKRDVILQLKDKGIAVMEIQEVEPSHLAKDITIGNPVKLRDFVVYLRQFATLLRAGVSIVDSTAILAQQTESKALKRALQDVEIELRAGNPFSQSAAKHKKVFPAMFINMIYAGEVSGSLDNVLDRLALYYEKQHKTRQKVISAMTYPVIVGLIAIGVVIFLLASVVPSFASMLNDLGGELPGITKVVLGASEFVQVFWWLIIMVFLLIVGLISIIRNKPSSKYYFDYAILKTPIFGKILQKATMAQMTRTLSSLFSSSVPILQSISIVEKVVGNEVVVKVLRESRTSLEQGKRLTEPFKQHWIFPPLVTQMIAIGEESGSLDAMLAKVADFYEDEVENATDRLKALIEPLMIVFLAAIVGVIVLSIIVPMFEIYNNVG